MVVNQTMYFLNIIPGSCGGQLRSLCQVYNQEGDTRDFPGRSVIRNPPANAGTWVRSLVGEDST